MRAAVSIAACGVSATSWSPGRPTSDVVASARLASPASTTRVECPGVRPSGAPRGPPATTRPSRTITRRPPAPRPTPSRASRRSSIGTATVTVPIERPWSRIDTVLAVASCGSAPAATPRPTSLVDGEAAAIDDSALRSRSRSARCTRGSRGQPASGRGGRVDTLGVARRRRRGAPPRATRPRGGSRSGAQGCRSRRRRPRGASSARSANHATSLNLKLPRPRPPCRRILPLKLLVSRCRYLSLDSFGRSRGKHERCLVARRRHRPDGLRRGRPLGAPETRPRARRDARTSPQLRRRRRSPPTGRWRSRSCRRPRGAGGRPPSIRPRRPSPSPRSRSSPTSCRHRLPHRPPPRRPRRQRPPRWRTTPRRRPRPTPPPTPPPAVPLPLRPHRHPRLRLRPHPRRPLHPRLRLRRHLRPPRRRLPRRRRRRRHPRPSQPPPAFTAADRRPRRTRSIRAAAT